MVSGKRRPPISPCATMIVWCLGVAHAILCGKEELPQQGVCSVDTTLCMSSLEEYTRKMPDKRPKRLGYLWKFV